MVIQITYSVARQIADHAEAFYPDEVCGLLAGTNNIITKAFPITNISESPQTHFQMNPDEEIKALKQMDSEALDWIGVYHSHPKSAPIPSMTDIKNAIDPKLIQLIVSLEHTKPQLKAWQIHDFDVQPIDLLFDTQQSTDDSHEPLSNSQKIAIILTSILSVIVMLTISITLLPPAPTITPIP